ncbi:hypothetical protein HOLleu_42091 [Holothuria leucospilota]|uniref:Uncharacterized protein n=1 Tax=Holothuria leucospilota TaxID=206669 RepID=A0A9Q0YBX3_HOLLE|nr:hypothetical protein HOLleu_42091 [Holothuria leucospilota]
MMKFKKLLGAIGLLPEASGKQTGYIQDRLKNMRRYLPGVAKKRSSHTTLTQNTQKVLKLHADNTPPQPIPEEEQKQLASFCKRATPDLKSDIKDARSRQKWIQEVHPTVTEILTEYPRFIDIDELAMYSFVFLVLLLPANSKSKGAKNQALDLLKDFQPVGESVEIYLMTEHRQ